jgi:hypothetical protein
MMKLLKLTVVGALMFAVVFFIDLWLARHGALAFTVFANAPFVVLLVKIWLWQMR